MACNCKCCCGCCCDGETGEQKLGAQCTSPKVFHGKGKLCDVCCDLGEIREDITEEDECPGTWVVNGRCLVNPCEDGPCVPCQNCSLVFQDPIPSPYSEFRQGYQGFGRNYYLFQAGTYFGTAFDQPVQFTWKEGYPQKLVECGEYHWVYVLRQTIGMDWVQPPADCPTGVIVGVRNRPGFSSFERVDPVGRIRYRWRLVQCDGYEIRDVTDEAVVLDSCGEPPPPWGGYMLGPPFGYSPNNSPCLEGEYCWAASTQNNSVWFFPCDQADILAVKCVATGQEYITELRPASPAGSLDALPTLECEGRCTGQSPDGTWQLALCDGEGCAYPVCDQSGNGVGPKFLTRRECSWCHLQQETCYLDPTLCAQENPLP
jgi:hypothetical protein